MQYDAFLDLAYSPISNINNKQRLTDLPKKLITISGKRILKNNMVDVKIIRRKV
jgi:hypothetical protein